MITAKKINEALNLNAQHSLYNKDGNWYHHLKQFPGILFDPNGYLEFADRVAYDNNSSLRHAQHLHVINGISSVVGYTTFSKDQKVKVQAL